jgi:hypothetical protein
MPNVYVEARPKGRPENSPIEDYVVEDHADHVLARRGNGWTKRFKKIADDAWHINAGSAIIDGEVVAPSAAGTTEFFRAAERTQGQIDQDCHGRFRSALSQWI